jgi:serine/threonine protein kinase/Cdc6-like AAA superfamily ATPase
VIKEMTQKKPLIANNTNQSYKAQFIVSKSQLSVDFPFNRNFEQYQSGVPLKSEFRFAHEPVQSNSNSNFVGRQNELDSMAERILFSNGGSFLVTGYRGVGKTSFVNQVINRVNMIMPWATTFLGDVHLLDIHLNVARPMQPAELMHHIIRRLYDKLIETGIYAFLSSSLQEELTLAYHRTSINMKRTVGNITEWKLSTNEIGFETGKDQKFGLKIPIGYSRSRSQNQEASFLGYDDKAAEHDIIQLTRRLAMGYVKPQTLRQRLFNWLFQHHPTLIRLKVIFVFDELDKLEEYIDQENDVKKRFIDEILNSLKNLFTTSGISFIFIAGKDLQESWLEDLGKGDSVYESVFSYHKYLPCLWSDIDQICDNFVDWQVFPTSHNTSNNCHVCQAVLLSKQMFCSYCKNYILDPNEARLTFDEFKKYLGYKGRGIPRRIIRGFNEYVQWNDKRPILVFSRQDIRQIRFYANLQNVLQTGGWSLFNNLHEENGAQQDKQLLGMYYLVDWMLRQGTRNFTLKDTVEASRKLSYKIAFADEIAPQIISKIIDFLLESEYLQIVLPNLSQVQIGDAEHTTNFYKLSKKCLGEMSSLIINIQEEPYAEQLNLETSHFGKYKLAEKIASGGMATVYKAWDDERGFFVAIKMLTLLSTSDAIKRFKREGEVMKRLNHPHIVRYYETGQEQNKFYITMDFVDGADLNRVLASQEQNRLDVDIAIAILHPIVEALDYVNKKGFIRNDIKPSNILLSRFGKVYLSDFGTAKYSEDTIMEAITEVPVPIGTPHYMSPELCQNQSPDVRSDIYSFGVVLYEVLTGERPFNGDFATIVWAHIHQTPTPPSEKVAIPSELQALIMRCLAKKPEYRFQSFSEISSVLLPFFRDVPLVTFIERTLAKIVTSERSRQMDTRPNTFKVNRTIIAERISEKSPDERNNNAFNPGPPTILPVFQSIEPVSQISFNQHEAMPSPVYSPPAAAEPASPSPDFRAYLLIHKSNETSICVPLNKPEIYIGRSPGNDIVFDTVDLSRTHARIVADTKYKNSYVIEDLNSSNRTYVNNIVIHTPYLLQDNDKIQIAEYILIFRC